MTQVLRNISALYPCKANGTQADIGEIKNAALVWDGETISWVGKESELPSEFSRATTFDAKGAVVIPGLIDCHTHLAFGGWRADEFEQRLLGKSYLEIAKAGGGILSTVDATRTASKEELRSKCEAFLKQMAALGVTTVECKSGYGLTVEDELKLLEVYHELETSQPLTIIPTLLAAHTVPREHQKTRERYLAIVCNELIPEVSNRSLARFCDVFVEDAAFSIDEGREVLQKGLDHGLGAKIHADQLSDTGGALLAAELGATSADHLECIKEDGVNALKESGTVAVSLPLASLYTQQQALNARALLDAGIPVAVATDFNPGSAPSFHLPLAMMLSCNLNRLTPNEALAGATCVAARALNLGTEVGSLQKGYRADFSLLDVPSINHWLYHFKANSCVATIKHGSCIHGTLSR